MRHMFYHCLRSVSAPWPQNTLNTSRTSQHCHWQLITVSNIQCLEVIASRWSTSLNIQRFCRENKKFNFPQFHQKTSLNIALTTYWPQNQIFSAFSWIFTSLESETVKWNQLCLQWINNLRLGKNLPWGVVMGWYKVGRDISSSRVKLFITVTSLT